MFCEMLERAFGGFFLGVQPWSFQGCSDLAFVGHRERDSDADNEGEEWMMISKSCFSPSSTALLCVLGGRPAEKEANKCSSNKRSMNVQYLFTPVLHGGELNTDVGRCRR